MQRVFDALRQVSQSHATVLVLGESGTGKELAAAELHRLSRRSEETLICVNCAAIPETLFESEVFGHERGAFTGSVETRKGMFELANGGTLFLDEIGETSLEMQAALQGVREARAELVDAHGLGQVVRGPHAHGVDGRLQRAVARDQEQGRLGL